MTHGGPFQPLLFCDSVSPSSVLSHLLPVVELLSPVPQFPYMISWEGAVTSNSVGWALL